MRFDATGFAEGGRKVHEIDEVVHHPARGDASRPACGQRHLAADVVKIALGAGHPGDAVVATRDDEGVVEFASGFEFL